MSNYVELDWDIRPPSNNACYSIEIRVYGFKRQDDDMCTFDVDRMSWYTWSDKYNEEIVHTISNIKQDATDLFDLVKILTKTLCPKKESNG